MTITMDAQPPPRLPERLARLDELAHDLWWTWQPARQVFRRLDYPLWRASRHNPVLMLRRIDPAALERAAADPAFLALYDEALAARDALGATSGGRQTWWREHVGDTGPVAYFSAEFAVHQSLPIYAGGLGVLAGDHCKEASDLGIPLVGVGFMYPQGYFRQRIGTDGWQHEVYEPLDWGHAPITAARIPDRERVIVDVPLGQRTVRAAVWSVQLGRTRLLLLDTDLEQNAPWDRELSARLYGGGRDTRLQQEIVLGLGGVLALRALGIEPAVWHLNEGHAAFVVLQRLRDFLAAGRAWTDALADVRRTTVFTTHTPVPAGHDVFPFHQVEQQLAGSWGSMEGHAEEFLALGHYDAGHGPEFNMTALAMRSAGAINAVSERHGEVSRDMFAPLWPGLPAGDRPIGTITNGVHAPTWIAAPLATLFAAHLGPDWADRADDPELWARVLEIPDAEVWSARRALRARLLRFVRERARDGWMRDPAGPARVVAGGVMLDPEVLTIGFARRFTAYKRADLLFADPDRLARLVSHVERPVQFVFAGKAHPADQEGKHRLQHVFRHAIEPRFGGRIAFLDDYDLHVAHRLVQGCDVWLNTPRRPLEASGTSGMKAAMNGVPNLSIADGWWAEGYTGTNGWVIDGGVEEPDTAAVDRADATALFELLEGEVVPAFYTRDEADLPPRWIAIVKQAIATVMPRFSTRRMLKEYARRAYAPACRPAARL